MKKAKITLSGSFALLAFSSAAYANGTHLLISTPFSFPRGWEWLPVAFMIMCGLWYNYSLADRAKHIKKTTIFAGITALSMILALGSGMLFAEMNTAPPPGFGLGFPAFRGYGWSDVGAFFLIGNLLGLLIIVAVIAFFIRNKLSAAIRFKKEIFLGGITIIYLIAVAPYPVARSMTFGWHGGYVGMFCESNIRQVERALAQYIIEHDGFLPEAANSKQFIAALTPYLNNANQNADDIFICPIADSFDHDAAPYIFRTEYSGMKLDDINVDPDVDLVYCYSEHFPGRMYSITLSRLKEWVSSYY